MVSALSKYHRRSELEPSLLFKLIQIFLNYLDIRQIVEGCCCCPLAISFGPQLVKIGHVFLARCVFKVPTLS
jgi:hypothetical protein